MRTSVIERKTKETDIALSLSLDGSGASEIHSGCGFLDHMLTLFAKHGGFDLTLTCKGDTEVDYHHTVEDIGISLGKALAKALGDKRGICRYGSMMLPMDETLILSAVDISGRAFYASELSMRAKKVGDFDVELVDEFFIALAQNAGITLHVRQLAGRNTHHIIEGVFKSVARSLRAAVSIDARFADAVPSTKGVLG
ncbi:MAG: imidazoleglycerol-phosphate dehydratase HisB [Clostridia bacterium]|nr:imidazoleglycerol-phosphate dehydratase HisB [Clostridia bacterium]MBQ8268765.1 imidazoleglycerol-phosphate dehydratase HisB [Clostridia bacterium]MBR2325599.1 imidazoleglycerol-phosphate dehydratase HisB [Clostridia bacterium]